MEPSSGPVVIDSSVLVALFIDGDSNHERAYATVSSMTHQMYVPYIAIEETASILTHRLSKELADQFILFVQSDARIVAIDSSVEGDMGMFLQINKKISFADVSIMSVARRFGLELLTFDKRMIKEFEKARAV